MKLFSRARYGTLLNQSIDRPHRFWIGGLLISSIGLTGLQPAAAYPVVESRWLNFAPPAQPPSAPLPASTTPNQRLCGVSATEASLAPSAQLSPLESIAPVIAAQLDARLFPEIHPRARLARVPVIMYHDILPAKEVFFDVTPAELEADLQLIRDRGMTPISLDQLTGHLATGIPLPEKPILLSFDDGYAGHYTHVLPLLRKYSAPAVFGIYPSKVGTQSGRSSLTWQQLREMAADPLVTIASHSVSHPSDLRVLPDADLRREVVESKRILETQLGIPVDHFVYPEGNNDARVQHWVKLAGYRSALTMNDEENRFAGDSESLLTLDRIGQSQLEAVIADADGGPPLPPWGDALNLNSPIRVNQLTVADTPLILISGGKPITIHADSRYQVEEIVAKAAHTGAIAAVDGGFFSLKYLDSNVMIGPVLSQTTGRFVPGNASENLKLVGRPLVLISPDRVQFVPFDPARHNTLEGVQAAQAGVTDAFVAAAWLVRDDQPQPDRAFGDLFDFNAARHRAFWGIDQSGQPVIGVSTEPVGSVDLGERLSRAGLRDAVMLDSGASTSLAYRGESMVGYVPRPVPHVVALVPPAAPDCLLIAQQRAEE